MDDLTHALNLADAAVMRLDAAVYYQGEAAEPDRLRAIAHTLRRVADGLDTLARPEPARCPA